MYCDCFAYFHSCYWFLLLLFSRWFLWYSSLLEFLFPFRMHKTDISFWNLSNSSFTEGLSVFFPSSPASHLMVWLLLLYAKTQHILFTFAIFIPDGLFVHSAFFYHRIFEFRTKWCMQINRIKRRHVRAIWRTGKWNSFHDLHILNANVSFRVCFCLCVSFLNFERCACFKYVASKILRIKSHISVPTVTAWLMPLYKIWIAHYWNILIKIFICRQK